MSHGDRETLRRHYGNIQGNKRTTTKTHRQGEAVRSSDKTVSTWWCTAIGKIDKSDYCPKYGLNCRFEINGLNSSNRICTSTYMLAVNQQTCIFTYSMCSGFYVIYLLAQCFLRFCSCSMWSDRKTSQVRKPVLCSVFFLLF